MNAVAPTPQLPSLGKVGKILFYLGIAAVVGGELLTWQVAPAGVGQIVWLLGILLELGSAVVGILDYLGRGGPKSGGDIPPPKPDEFLGGEHLVATPASSSSVAAAVAGVRQTEIA